MNLLTDPLLRVETETGLARVSLPELLQEYGEDRIFSFPGLQRHQEDAFHVFLCYLGGAVLARRGVAVPVQKSEFWREGLSQLADNAGYDAWQLVVDDWTRPAFLQPPLPRSHHSKLKLLAETPDELDLLPTAKNHDVKRARASAPEPDEWIFALMSLQTMSGFFGRDTPGISRMNGGFGNRTIVELRRSERPGGCWQDAVVRLIQYRQALLDSVFGYDPNGLVLVWQAPWDGQSSLRLSELDPFYVEICRRIRLCGDGRIERAEIIPSKSNRIDAKAQKGVVGDPWLPVDQGEDSSKSDFKALTVSPLGLTPELLRRLVFQREVAMSVLQQPGRDWRGDSWLKVSVLVRGQGRTDGFHERSIPIPKRVLPNLFHPSQERPRPLELMSKAAIDSAGVMQGSVLRPALLVFLEGGPETLKARDASQSWWSRVARQFEGLWSADYFRWLWDLPDGFDEDEVILEWQGRLRDWARCTLVEARDAMPCRAGRRFRAYSQSDRMFWGALYRQFPQLKEARNESIAADEAGKSRIG